MDVIARAEEQAAQAFGHGIDRALATFRWLTIGWATIGVLIGRQHLDRPLLAIGALALAIGFTGLTTMLLGRRSPLLGHPALIAVELIIGAITLLADGAAFDAARAQSLPWAWPAAGIIAAGITLGARAGAASAVILGFASYLGDARTSQSEWGVAASSKAALYVLAGVVAAYVARRLREAEVEITAAKARAEVARTLHDGVLQTLAVVQRRSTDRELAALAREQEHDLREYLFGIKAEPRSLAIALHESANAAHARYGISVEVVTADDLPRLEPAQVEALAGAVSEAVTNAAKHGEASRVVVYAEPTDDGVFCSVKDDGVGFDPEDVTLGQGIDGSIRDRLDEIGGSAHIRSQPGRGTEVQLTI
ncbi:MAG: sensor histidine kinase [Acidimicrobiales bacterium]